MKPRPASRVPGLTAFTAIDPSKVDRTTIRWHKDLLDSTLRSLWTTNGGISMKLNVYTHRLIGALRARFDREGYHLRTQTEISSGNVVIWIRQKRHGNRPSR